MKQFFLLSFLFLHFFTYCQQTIKINKIDWVGKNNVYLNISKKKASFESEKGKQRFTVLRLEKDFFTLSLGENGEQRYDIVYFTLDTLIIAPVGVDALQLGQLNEHNQYLFVNSTRFPFLSINLVKFHFETNLDFYVRVSLGIDFRGNTRVSIIDDYNADKTVVKSPLGKMDCERLISILANCDINNLPCENYVNEDDIKCCNSFFEIQYNGQIKRCRGCSYFPFSYPKLENFISDVILTKAGRAGAAPTIRY